MEVNSCTLVARLARVPHVGKTQNGQIICVASFVTSGGRDISVRVVVYGNDALALERANVGDEFVIVGSLSRNPQSDELRIKAQSILKLEKPLDLARISLDQGGAA